MAIIARFSIDVPFGSKAKLFEVIDKYREFQKEKGFPEPEVLIGSIGAPESRVEVNYRYESIAALEQTWSKLDDPRMAEFQKAMAPLIVPGSHRWEVFRVQE